MSGPYASSDARPSPSSLDSHEPAIEPLVSSCDSTTHDSTTSDCVSKPSASGSAADDATGAADPVGEDALQATPHPDVEASETTRADKFAEDRTANDRSAADDSAVEGPVRSSVEAPVRRLGDAAAAPNSTGALYKLSFLMTVLGLLLVSVTIVPHLAEELQYRLERGRQRAQVEIAEAHLSSMPLAGLSKAYQLVSHRVGPSVVHINVAESPQTAGDAPGRLPVGHPRVMTGQGSGVIVDSSGYIVTNRHVIEGARSIEVSLSDGRRFPGRIVGVDNATDLAVLRIDAENLSPAEWGDSNETEVGSLVWAVGSPFGLERSITFGILSAKHRAGLAGSPLQDLMQTDAAVNPGNSGGPLVDAHGRVIGINTAIVGPSYSGVSFAIPSSVARRVYDQVKDGGRVARGWFGVEMAVVPPEMMRDLGWNEPRGVLVRSLTDERYGESPARAAGVLPGDIVQIWNGVAVTSPAALVAQVASTPIGRPIQVKLLRDGQSIDLEVTVGQRPTTID